MIIGTLRGIHATIALKLSDLSESDRTPCVIIRTNRNGGLEEWLSGDLISMPDSEGFVESISFERVVRDRAAGGTGKVPDVMKFPASDFEFLFGRGGLACIRPEDLGKIKFADPEPTPYGLLVEL